MKARESESQFWNELRAQWRTLLGASMGLATGINLYIATQSFFIKPLQTEFGWSRGTIALGSLALILTALLQPVAGFATDRFGARKIATIGALGLTVSFLALAAMPGSLIVYFMILPLNASLSTFASTAVFMKPIVDSFDRSRGTMLGVATSATALFMVIVPPLLQSVIGSYGWRFGYLSLACLPALIGLTGARLLPVRTLKLPYSTGATLGQLATEVFRERNFWLLAVAMLGASFAVGGFLAQLLPMLSDRGMSPQISALLVSLIALAMLLGRLTAGAALDHYSVPHIASANFCVPAFGTLLLVLSTSFAASLIATLSLGLVQGAEASILGFIVARTFRLSIFTTVTAMLSTCVSMSAAVGAATFGAAFDHFGNYDVAIVGGSFGFWIAAVAIFLVDPGKKPSTAPVSDVFTA
jgi:MFS family permease